MRLQGRRARPDARTHGGRLGAVGRELGYLEGDDVSRHVPWCDSQIGPEFEVRDGVVHMTITACMGCADEPEEGE